MKELNHELKAVDLFSGSGGLSLGFEESGFTIAFAVEKDPCCAKTYKMNREKTDTEVVVKDISEIDFTITLRKMGLDKGEIDVLLSGPPCQGFSKSNMRTRSLENPKNHLFKEFLRSVKEIWPKWILLENVPGMAHFENGRIVETIESELDKLGYSHIYCILDTVYYGIPQARKRFFLVGNRMGLHFSFPNYTHGILGKPCITVFDAISDLPELENGNKEEYLPYRNNNPNISEYQVEMRKNWHKDYCVNNQVTKNSDLVISRYRHIPPSGNWKDIPHDLMRNYKDNNNTHSGIYARLKWDEPSIVVSNFRKNMLIHPEQDRGLSVREAARLQSFPDWYIFNGGLASQQQQVADAVPPILAKKLGDRIREYIRGVDQ